ncbi:hypothetical protein VTP01DRAFT_5587 [Rhizomucor pusillus]|uniref:uncharacterized protein n=1 Tax=Rhizomucor pusillus TaxID=4840 RepID=UPI003743D100
MARIRSDEFGSRLMNLTDPFPNANAPYRHHHTDAALQHIFILILLQKEPGGQNTQRLGSPKSCSRCYCADHQVQVKGHGLASKTGDELYQLLIASEISGLWHVAKRDAQSCAYLHFDTHDSASVYYNTKKNSTFFVDGLELIVKPTKLESGQLVIYSQQTLSFEPAHEPAPIQIPVPECTPPPTPTSSSSHSSSVSPPWKRTLQESYNLLEEEIEKTRRKLRRLER